MSRKVNFCFRHTFIKILLFIHDLQALEKNAEHIVPKPTWADIVKGEPSNFNVKKKGNESFPPLMPSVKFEKPGCKGLSPIMNVQQVGDTSKRSKSIILHWKLAYSLFKFC